MATPAYRWLTPIGRQQLGEVLFENGPYRRRPTDVFACVMLPDAAFDPDAERSGRDVPGVVCVHGGGGRAFYEWAVAWAARGYAAIAMDLAGGGEGGQRCQGGQRLSGTVFGV